MSSNHDRYGSPMYGAVHKAERKRFAMRMKAGEVFYCWRPTCPRPHEPVDPRRWDLGHVDLEFRGEFGSRWPGHPACNRATLTHAMAANGRPATAKADRFGGVAASAGVKDPRTGLLREPGESAEEHWLKVGPPDSWSRHWFGGYTDRCPDCRRLGRACDAVDSGADVGDAA